MFCQFITLYAIITLSEITFFSETNCASYIYLFVFLYVTPYNSGFDDIISTQGYLPTFYAIITSEITFFSETNCAFISYNYLFAYLYVTAQNSGFDYIISIQGYFHHWTFSCLIMIGSFLLQIKCIFQEVKNNFLNHQKACNYFFFF